MIGPEHPIDVDDLVARCRTENARKAFGDAVAAYHAGAYRACIVVTWAAVVFDYVGKLRELELSGNAAAAGALVQWETARKNSNYVQSMALENQLLEEAGAQFELLTPIERQDLERLHLDRHRCAHPSLLTLDEPYQPSAELARVHMRHAVGHLLARPPVQGKEAFDRIWADISSEYFPADVPAATERLNALMSRARSTLVRKVAVELVRGLLLTGTDEAPYARTRAAFLAAMKLHPGEVAALLRDKLPSLAERVVDADLQRLAAFCRNVEQAWEFLGAPGQGRLRLFVGKTTLAAALADACQVSELNSVATSRIGTLDDKLLVLVAREAKRTDFLEEITTRLEKTTQFTQISDLRDAVGHEDLRPLWTIAQRKRLITTLTSNRDVLRYMGYATFVEMTIKVCRLAPEDTRNEWRTLYDSVSASYSQVAAKIRGLYPDFPPLPSA